MQKALQASATVLCVVLTVCAVYSTVLLRDLVAAQQAATYSISELADAHANAARLVSEMVNSLSERSDGAATIVSEGILVGLAMAMEDERMIGPTQASSLISESIERTAAQSERLGELLRLLNDHRVNRRRR